MTTPFKTNITNYFDAIRLKELLLREFPAASFYFDLLHKDKLLHVEGKNVPSALVIQIIKHEGFYCEIVSADTGSSMP